MPPVIPPFPRRPTVLQPTLTTFPVMDFPLEIRNMIWDFTLPRPRAFEVLNEPAAHAQERSSLRSLGPYPSQEPPFTDPEQQLVFANINNEPLHPLACVSREARAYVLARFRPLKLSKTTKWIDLSHDILLFEPYLLVGRLIQSLRHLQDIPDMRDNVQHIAFGVSFETGRAGDGDGSGSEDAVVSARLSHPISSHRFSDFHMTTLLSVLSRFPKLREILFVVHQEFHFDCELPVPVDGDSSSTSNGNHDRTRALHFDSDKSENPSPEPLDSFYSSEPFHLHQGYLFGFDVEKLLNGDDRVHPQENFFYKYPLASVKAGGSEETCESKGKGKEDVATESRGPSAPHETSRWGLPWPTNEVWERFVVDFQSVVDLAAEKLVVDGDVPVRPPALGGTALLWRYT